MSRYGSTAKREVQKALNEFDHGTLTNSSGQKVTSHEQAIAIGLSKAREKGAELP